MINIFLWILMLGLLIASFATRHKPTKCRKVISAWSYRDKSDILYPTVILYDDLSKDTFMSVTVIDPSQIIVGGNDVVDTITIK